MNTTDNHFKKKQRPNPDHNNRHRKSQNSERREAPASKNISRKKFKNYFTRESRKLYSSTEILQIFNDSPSFFSSMTEHAAANPQCFSSNFIPPTNFSTKAFNPIKALIISYSKRENGRNFQRDHEKEKIPDWYDPGKESKTVMQGSSLL